MTNSDASFYMIAIGYVCSVIGFLLTCCTSNSKLLLLPLSTRAERFNCAHVVWSSTAVIFKTKAGEDRDEVEVFPEQVTLGDTLKSSNAHLISV